MGTIVAFDAYSRRVRTTPNQALQTKRRSKAANIVLFNGVWHEPISDREVKQTDRAREKAACSRARSKRSD